MAVIYKIFCLHESIKESYIGSTMDFKKRMKLHKHSCNNENSKKYNVPLYQFIRENGGIGAWEMTIIDSLTTIDKKEVEKCERKYIEELEFSLNKFIPARKKKEYIKDHKEEIAEYMKKYCENNRKELSEKKKQYYEANREAICKKNKEKVQCERCGAFSVKGSLLRHQRSKKCMNAN